MKKKTVFVGIVNLKGGTGKSAITTVVASMLHYTLGKNVAIIDGDKPQYSIFAMRERDKNMVSINSYYKNLFYRQHNKTQKNAYSIKKSDPKDIIQCAGELLDRYPGLDLIFFDLSGSVSAEGTLATILNLDYVFCPLITDRIVLESSVSFITTIKEWIDSHKESYPLKGIYPFWNRIDNRENKMIYNVGNRILEELGVKRMKTEIPETNKFKKEISPSREIFRSTMFPPNKSLLQNTQLEAFIEELCRIIKK